MPRQRNVRLGVKLFGTCLLVGCASAPPSTVRSAIVGTWSPEGVPCRDVSLAISIPDNGATLVVHASEPLALGDTNLEQSHFEFRILGETRWVLRTVMDGETRRADDGSLVFWDVNLLESGQFCWRRGDWTQKECSERYERCPTPAT